MGSSRQHPIRGNGRDAGQKSISAKGRLLTVSEITSVLRFDVDGHKHPDLATRRLLEAGQAGGFKLCRRWRAWEADVDEFLRSLAAEAVQGVR